MRAVVFHGVGDIRIDNVPDPKIKDPNDAIVRLTASAICGTDLHMVRGTVIGMKSGRILGHEGVGIVEEVGNKVRSLKKGDRVVIGSTIACGYCSYCRAGFYSQCDNANPNAPTTAFFGGPENAGGYDGMQAQFVRVPFASVNCVKLPDEVSDDQAILISDIFPTGYMAAELADIHPGRTVAVFGCGPVGQFTIASLKLLNAGRIFAIDTVPSRLAMAQAQGAEIIDYNRESPVEILKEITGGIGPDRVIDCVGVDANMPHSGPAEKNVKGEVKQFKKEVEEIAPKVNAEHGNWEPGDAPSMVLQWMVESVAKAGQLSIIGVYPETVKRFPIGAAMFKNLTIKMGNCNHRKYIPMLLDIVRAGVADPTEILTQVGPLTGAIQAFEHFDKREEGWIKVELEPAAAPSKAA
jgi:threonine dehydrogenase-like Zn-dependent dehydrogenase